MAAEADKEKEDAPADETATEALLSDDTPLYRSLTRAVMVDWERIHPGTANHFLPIAFMRRGPHPSTRQPRDTDGFSVTLLDGRTQEAVVAAEQTSKPEAICRLVVGEVRSLSGTFMRDNTVVSVDVLQDRPDHADIVGLPEVPEDPPLTEGGRKAYADAEFLGGKLAAMAQLVWHKQGGRG